MFLTLLNPQFLVTNPLQVYQFQNGFTIIYPNYHNCILSHQIVNYLRKELFEPIIPSCYNLY